MLLELKQGLILPIELGVNHALSYAPGTLAALRPYQGQLLALHISQLADVYIRFVDDGLQLSLASDAEANASLSGPWHEFLRLARASNKSDVLINSTIDMAGDSDLPIKIARILETLNIDWEALLSPLTGGLVAHQMGRGFRQFWRFGQQAKQQLQVMGKSYVEDERQWLANRNELEHFAEQVDDLKLASDRLQARVELLLTQHAKE